MCMIYHGFLPSAERLELEACVRRQREDHSIARRANAILLLDDGKSSHYTTLIFCGFKAFQQASAFSGLFLSMCLRA